MNVKQIIEELNTIPEKDREKIEVMFNTSTDKQKIYFLKSIDVISEIVLEDEKRKKVRIILFECNIDSDQSFTSN